MKNWRTLLGITLVASCGQMGLQHHTKASRRPASLPSRLLAIPVSEFQQDIRRQWSDLHAYQLHAYEALEAFDASLEHDTHPLKGHAYADLMAARAMGDATTRALITKQDELRVTVLDHERPLFEREAAMALLLATLPTPQDLEGVNRLTLSPMHLHHEALIRSLLLNPVKELTPFQQKLKSLYGGLPDPQVSMTADWRTLTRKERQNPKLASALNLTRKSIDHLSQEYRLEMQSLTSRKDNLLGSELPPKVWALTFDGGLHPSLTPRVLGLLKDHDLKASFFLLGKEVDERPELVEALKSAGMDVASRGHETVLLSKASEDERDLHITASVEDLNRLHGRPAHLFRLPYGLGMGNRDLQKRLEERQLTQVFWSVDAVDWLAQSPQDVSARVLKQMQHLNSGVILFHDSFPHAPQALAHVLPHLKQEGRRNCALSQMLEQMSKGLAVCHNQEAVALNP